MYYTLTALGIRVPTGVKRTLTTMQIIQFVIGASFAFAHLFIAYTIPVSTPYTYSLADLTSIASAVTTDAASTVSVATATATAGLASILKKLAFRAAGREGLAENVVNEQGETFGLDAVHAAQDLKAREEIRYRDELRWIHCTDTSGQVFAILLNCMYLAPLTLLFVQFFIRSYTQRLERRRSSTAAYNIEQSAKDAYKGVARQTMDAIGEMHGNDDTFLPEGAMESTKEKLSDGAKAIQKLFTEGVDSAKKSLQDAMDSGKKAAKSTEKSSAPEADTSKDPPKREADSGEPNSDKPDSDKPDATKPGSSKPDSNEPDPDKPNSDKSDPDKPDSDKPDSDKPDSDKPDATKPGSSKSESSKPDSDKPDATKPGSSEPDSKLPKNEADLSGEPMSEGGNLAETETDLNKDAPMED